MLNFFPFEVFPCYRAKSGATFLKLFEAISTGAAF